MAVTVYLRFPGREGEDDPRLTFDGPRIVLGRGRECDVRLPDARVARRHASLRAEKGGYVLYDEGSINGTFASDVRLAPGAPHAVKNGETLRLGPVWLEVRFDASLPTRDPAAAARAIALDELHRRRVRAGQAVDPEVIARSGREGREARLRLAVDDLEHRVGRGADCALPLLDAKAPDVAFCIVHRSWCTFVRAAAPGLTLAGEMVQTGKDVPWRPGVLAAWGGTAFTLDEPVLAALATLEEEDEAPLLPSEVPPPPAPRHESTRGRAAPPSTPPPSSRKQASVPPPPERRERGWSATDVGVLALAAIVLVLSVVGFVWLLRK